MGVFVVSSTSGLQWQSEIGTLFGFLTWRQERLINLKSKREERGLIRMNLSIGGGDQNDNMALLVGGQNSNKLDKISIPEAITVNGRDILEIQNQSENTENFK